MLKYMLHFSESWYVAYHNWIEYSAKEDVTFYLCCYILKNDQLSHNGGEAFTSKGFRNWNKRKSFDTHVGEANKQCA